MRALTVIPGKAGTAALQDREQPSGDADGVKLQTLCVGICGTDREIVAGRYGWAPPGRATLVIGHECVARVAEDAAGFQRGELVVPIVRRPDPVPCAACAAGEWDMCRNGRYTEHGIKELDGYCAEQLRVNPDFLVRVPESLGKRAVLTEPASVVAKAWEHIEHIGRRAHWEPRRALVTGAGPVGLLAALLGRQRGLEVTVYDRVTGGRKPELVRLLGAKYSTGPLHQLLKRFPPDMVLECTGATPVLLPVIEHNPPGCVVCLLGVSAAGKSATLDMGALNRSLVLENDVVFGSVNANRRHYAAAAEALGKADPHWLDGLITRREPLAHWREALERGPDDVKVLLEVAA